MLQNLRKPNPSSRACIPSIFFGNLGAHKNLSWIEMRQTPVVHIRNMTFDKISTSRSDTRFSTACGERDYVQITEHLIISKRYWSLEQSLTTVVVNDLVHQLIPATEFSKSRRRLQSAWQLAIVLSSTSATILPPSF